MPFGSYLWNLYIMPLLLFVVIINCFPTSKFDSEEQLELKDEKRFPNGTVIGKYSYTDNEGNPIHVKYYADESSYGVELKSIKVVENGEPLDIENKNNAFEYDSTTGNKVYGAKDLESEPKVSSDVLHSNNPPTTLKRKYNDPYDFLTKEVNKHTHYKAKATPDYEIYYQNELKGPMCGKEKFKIYLDKQNRHIRSANDNSEAEKFCEQI